MRRALRRTSRSSSRPTATSARWVAQQPGRDDWCCGRAPASCTSRSARSASRELQARAPRRRGDRAPRVRGGGARAGRLHRVDDGLIERAVKSPAQTFIVAHRGRHPPPDAASARPTRQLDPGARPRTRAARATSARTCGSTRSRSSTSACAISQPAGRRARADPRARAAARSSACSSSRARSGPRPRVLGFPLVRFARVSWVRARELCAARFRRLWMARAQDRLPRARTQLGRPRCGPGRLPTSPTV